MCSPFHAALSAGPWNVAEQALTKYDHVTIDGEVCKSHALSTSRIVLGDEEQLAQWLSVVDARSVQISLRDFLVC
jgi:hypothetical protein